MFESDDYNCLLTNQEELDKINNNKFINFTNMNSIYGDHMELLCRKGFYPYEYIDNETKLDEIGLPPQIGVLF
jgi:hypothetical protein